MKNISEKIVCLVGPTAVGKTSLAIELARLVDGEIVNADSRQIYAELDIGSAKPTLDERDGVIHHLIDCAHLEDPWSVAQFIKAAQSVISDICSRGKVPLLVGGTGLYVKKLLFGLDDIPAVDPAVRAQLAKRLQNEGLPLLYRELESLDPVVSARLSENDTQRILRALEVYYQTGKSISFFWKSDEDQAKYTYLKLGLKLAREILYQNINVRVDQMIAKGLKEEAVALFDKFPKNDVLLKTIGYAEWSRFGFDDQARVIEEIKKNSRQFAKRQMTWFGNEDDVVWFESGEKNELIKNVMSFLK